MDSLWGCSKVHIQGQRSSPAGLANSGADSNSPGRCSAGSCSALRRSRGSWSPSWWASHSRRKRRRRRKSPAASSCCDPWGCRASATPAGSREPSREGDMEDYDEDFANVSRTSRWHKATGSPGMPVSGVSVLVFNEH